MQTTSLRSFGLCLSALAMLLVPLPASAANVLLVSDTTYDSNIATVLMGDGHTVTVVTGDFATGNAALRGDLSAYDVVYWSASGTGFGDVHGNAAVFTNLTNYVSTGGRVFVTGYDSIASPTDPMLIAFLGGSGSQDVPGAPGVIASVDNALTTGVVDIRGVTPTGGSGDRDAMTGLMAGTTPVTGTTANSQWTLRAIGSGFAAYVSNGDTTATTASWNTTTPTTGAHAYNAALRNFAFNATGASGMCTGEGTACTTMAGRTGTCHMDRCCTGCWDGTRCNGGTTGTACGVDGGACISCADGMPCTSDVCTAGACTNPMAPTGTACDDGMFCTTGDTCDAAGTCTSGGVNGCADASACTVDSCNEATDTCDHVVGGGCFIGAACIMGFTVNSANPCQVCDPARSTTDWSPRTVGIPCGNPSCTTVGGFGTLTDVGMCDATGTCVVPAPMACPSGRCSGTSACNPACASGSCPGGLLCSTATMRCVTPVDLGGTCAANSECTSGFCADGVCCSSACDGLCDSCDLPGSEGMCMPSPSGRECGLPICVGGRITAPGACDAAGMCMRMGAMDCPSGLCLDATTCDVNCNATSCPTGQICTAAMRCVTPAADGEACTAGDECISGSCADGVCCNSACGDVCESCDQPGREGRCTPYTAFTDPELECPIGSVCGGGRACTVGMPDAGPPDAGPADAGPPDAGPIDAAVGFDGGAPDATVEVDAGEPEAPRRGCSCSAVGFPERETGALAVLLGGLALVATRRRRR